MADKFNSTDYIDAPSRHVFLITPSDTVELPALVKGIRSNTAGTVVYRPVDSDVDVTMTLAAGETLPVRVRFVRSTNTTPGIILHGLA